MSELKKKTTIAIHKDVKKSLDKLKRGRDDYDAVVKRLISGVSDVYVEFVLVDHELPQTHSVVFQMGTDADSLYYFDGSEAKPITLKEAQVLLKQPKPNMTVTREEALFIQYILMQPLTFPAGKPEFDQIDQNLEKRIKEFLEGMKVRPEKGS